MKYIFIIILISYNLFSEFSMGVNLDDNGAFVNLINHTNRYNKASSFDSLGWPQSDFELVVFDKRPVAEWASEIDDPEKYRVDYTGLYTCSFSGLADLFISGTNAAISSKYYDTLKNATFFEFEISGPQLDNHGIVFLNFTNTRRSLNHQINTGITELRINHPGYNIANKQTFTNEFIALCKAADFACYRFYNLQNIWDGEPVFPEKNKWENRKTPKDAAQLNMSNLNGKKDGWCWEYIVELANILEKDIWINIHISCDSNYVINLAKFLKENLKPNINIYVENSNEVWSPTHMSHGAYNDAQAKFYGITFDQNYARRTVELSNLFAEVFGEEEINRRIRVILAGQHAYPGRSDNQLNFILNKYSEPRKFIYSLSTALYFQSTKANSTDPLQINNGMIEDIESQITNDQSIFYRNNHINKVDFWSFEGKCTSYEGGPHLPSGGGKDNLSAQILSHRTKEMGDIIKYNYLEGWKNLDGGLAMYFTLSSGYNRYGCWGLTDDFRNPDRNYKMQSIRDIIASYKTNVSENDDNLNIYPNPSNGNAILNLNFLEEIQTLQILDFFGKSVNNFEINQNKIKLNNFSNGMYYILFNNKFATKIIVIN